MKGSRGIVQDSVCVCKGFGAGELRIEVWMVWGVRVLGALNFRLGEVKRLGFTLYGLL